MRPSAGGVYGPGVYFYDDIKDAKAFSAPGGGVIVAEVDHDDPDVEIVKEEPVTAIGTDDILRYTRIIVVRDPTKITIIDKIPGL